MDLTKPVIYRGLDVNSLATSVTPQGSPLSGYLLKRVQYSDVQGEGYREKRAMADGYDAASVYLGYRPVNLQGEVYGLSRADLWDRIQLLRRTLTPTLAYASAINSLGFHPLTFSQSTADLDDWPTGVADLSIRCRPQAQPSFVVEEERTKAVNEYGYVMAYTAALWARDPRIYVASPKVVTMSGTAGSGTYVNRGDYPSPLHFILNVTSAGAKTFHFVGLGTSFDVTFPDLSVSRIVNVITTDKVVTYQTSGTEVLRMDYISFGAGFTWPSVPPGGGTYSWTMTGGPLVSGSMAFYDEAYV